MTGDTSGGKPSGRGGVVAMVGLGVFMVACCAGPVLIAGGVLGALGAAVRSPWLIAAGVVVVLAAAVYTVRRGARRRTGGAAEDCDTAPGIPTRTGTG
jgi:mercuric ion transport protein